MDRPDVDRPCHQPPRVNDVFRFSSETMPLRTAFDAYQAIYAPGADPVMESPLFRAAMTSHRFFRLNIHDRRLRAVRHLRSADRVRHAGFSHFTATLCLVGDVHGSDANGFRRIRPGEILLLDMSRPSATRFEEGRILTVAIAREVLEGVVGDARHLHGRILGMAQAAPLTRYLTTLTTFLHVDTANDEPAQNVRALLHAALDPEPDGAVARQTALRRFEALRIIEASIDDPDLDATELAVRLGISRATLYRVFEPLGGVGRYILQRRLLRFRHLLADGGSAASIAALAARVGIAGESHASRAFLDRFADRPGSFRRMTRDLTAAGRAALAMTMWQDDLR